MLESFSVEGFRTFSKLRIDRLARVNLIVGKNNVGKTVLLEALRLYAEGGNLFSLFDSFMERYHLDPADFEKGAWPLQTLFHRGKTGQDDARILSVGPLDSPAKVVRIYLLLPGETLPKEVAAPPEFSQANDHALRVVSAGPGGGLAVKWADFATSNARGMPLLFGFPKGPIYPSAFMPARGMPRKEIERWWDAIALQEPEEHVLTCLRLVENVERISMVEHPPGSGQRIVIVRLDGDPRPIPLRSLGDGMDRIFQIALSLAWARFGRLSPNIERGWGQSVGPDYPDEPVLLLDEIENGIHYSVLPKLWEFLMRTASSQNVQIFTTTHSWDCIEAFQAAAAAVPDVSCQLLRLERYKEDIEAVLFDKDELPIVTRDEIEVRG